MTYSEDLNKTINELIRKTIAQQDAKLRMYATLKNLNLPIPPDLQAEIDEMEKRKKNDTDV